MDVTHLTQFHSSDPAVVSVTGNVAQGKSNGISRISIADGTVFTDLVVVTAPIPVLGLCGVVVTGIFTASDLPYRSIFLLITQTLDLQPMR